MSSALKEIPPLMKKTKLHKSELVAEKWRRAKRMRLLYLFVLIPMVSLFIFHYVPIYGVIMAFKDFRYRLGILGSPWNNFEHFKRFFSSPYIYRVLRNTVVISLLRIIFGFPAPIIFALLLNELRNQSFKKIMQSISYLPHFMSWIVLSGIVIEVLSPQRGLVGYIYSILGSSEAPNVFLSRQFFRPMLIVTGIWQSVGWGSIIYFAALSNIDPSLYESATVDGANRFQMAVRITIPSLVPVMTILLILRMGRILNAGFDQIFNLYNPVVYEVADIIDTYVFRVGILNQKYGFSAAAGLFKNAVGFVLIFGTNWIIRKFSDYGLW